MILTAGDIQSCCACPRRCYLDMHGDRAERAPLSEFARKLLHDGRDHERRIVQSLKAHAIEFDGQDTDGAVQRTLDAMRAGHRTIAGAVLRAPSSNGDWDRIGVADLLVRAPGKSQLGRHHYEPVEIRTARRVKHPYRLQLAYYGHLLADVQGVWPERGYLILGDGTRHAVPFRTLRAHYERVLEKIHQIRDGEEPSVHITARCLQCSWHPSCLPLARREGHLSLVHGLNRRHAVQLQAQGIQTFQELAACDPDLVAVWIEDSTERAQCLVMQARSLTDDQPVWCRPPDLPAATCEIFFDIEGDPEHDVFYLFGMLHRSRGEER
jgi:predicted RecB family nuclease